MSSPTEPRCSQADFLARWIPSSSRAGVILKPSVGLAGPLQPISPASPTPLHPDNSFSSDFAPLPASADSSCLDVCGCVGSAGNDRPVNGLTNKVQDLPLMMKLDQLRKWQQHMQEQLKAHQLEELLSLQEEHHRIVNGSQRTSVLGQENQLSAPIRQELLLKCQGCENDEEEEEMPVDAGQEHDDASTQHKGVVQREGDGKHLGEVGNDRPIQPGLGGQKQTFEELLEEQLRLEEQRLKFVQQQQKQEAVQAPPKRPFLKRGQGLSRFTNKHKAGKKDYNLQPHGRVISSCNSAPDVIVKGSSTRVPRLPVQRKIAVLNKENRVRGLCSPPQDTRAERKKVLGCHQRRNTEPEAIKTKNQPGHVEEHSGRKVIQVLRTCSPNMQQNPVTKKVLGGQTMSDSDTDNKKSSGSKVESAEVRSDSEKGVRVPMESLESFQEKLRHWERDRQMESMELGEFELLEEAAEELSFSSNSSFVMKVLQMDQQKRQAAVGLHRRRLSSTPIKLPGRSEPQQRCPAGAEPETPGVTIRSDALKNNESSEREDGQSSEEEGKHEVSDGSSGCASDFGDKVAIKGTACFTETSDPPYDKWSYQDEGSCRDSSSDVGQEDVGESEGVPSSSDDSTLIEDRDSQQGRVVFDDDDTWNDLDETAVSRTDDSREFHPDSSPAVRKSSPPEKVLLRKVAAKVVDVGKDLVPDPPASQLMSRFFPSLKPQAQNTPLPLPAPESNRPKDETAQQVQSRQLRERLAELEIEIGRFKKENAALVKLRQENERKQEELRKERLEFERKKTEELAKFEEHKREENRKLQKERKLFEKHASLARAIPDKKEREEIQLLKQQLSSLQEELKRKESRWSCTHSRLKQQIDSLNQENSSLRDEIRTLEKLRLSALKRNSSAEKVAGTKDVLRISESRVSSATKGVTFASPLDSRGSSSSPPLIGKTAPTRISTNDISQGATGIKSSLRSAGLLPVRMVEEKPGAASWDQEAPNQEFSQDRSPKTDVVPKQAESCESNELQTPQEVIKHPDGKVEKVLASGDRLIVFPNGTRKEITADGLSAKVTFFNGDTKQITADQRVIYYYSEAQTTHITYPDGVEVLLFPNNQTEKHFPDGRKEITFPDQTVKNLFPDGREESVLTDGTVIRVNPDNTKEIHFNTGQKEIHTAEFKRREYPDGTVKTVYAHGRQETRYPTGRVRVKDKDGNVIQDQQA
ncbi:centromere protein J isoform X2 [Nothobranchius furzeri]|uniref:Centromere protein J n=1 Tax=Nothobranchius furzeri TaxID=105023 RepID=A0A1A8AGB4_NOTFU|nr:centromere protein J isoform X2 [Nothobranchius furzeri]KAF7215319.1 transcript variant X2 [Nothobranchius furzeri]